VTLRFGSAGNRVAFLVRQVQSAFTPGFLPCPPVGIPLPTSSCPKIIGSMGVEP
jgi:hypothetical protein